MAYRYKLLDPFDAGTRRIGMQQIDRLIEQIAASADTNVKIHGTRKGLKRIRALLRLVRPALGEDAYTRENVRFRDIGRKLAAARDQHVLIETVDRLEHVASGRTRQALTAARTKLGGSAGSDPSRHAVALEQALEDLRAARGSMAELAVEGDGLKPAFTGLARAYRQAANACDEAFKSDDAEPIHEFRKRVQHHWRHMMLLRDAWPELLEARIATARQLSELLGEDHDIAAMLAAVDHGAGSASLTESQRKLTRSFAITRQQGLRRQARILAGRLFTDDANAFAGKIEMYWVGAKAEAAEARESARARPLVRLAG